MQKIQKMAGVEVIVSDVDFPEVREVDLKLIELARTLQGKIVTNDFNLNKVAQLRGVEVLNINELANALKPVVLPGEFMGLAEETGLVLPLGRRILLRACAQVASWRSLGHRAVGVSVNISAKQLASRRLLEEVTAALASSELDPAALTLEITESMLLDSRVVIRRLEELKALGVRIAIDDFGTGYSSLNHLRRFPVDTLKIARAFVEELGTSPEQERLVAAILRLGTTLGLESIAEGVETEAQRDRLLALRCRYAQGFLYSPPLPEDELAVVLSRARVA